MFRDPVMKAWDSPAFIGHYTRMLYGIVVRKVIAHMNNIGQASVICVLPLTHRPIFVQRSIKLPAAQINNLTLHQFTREALLYGVTL